MPRCATVSEEKSKTQLIFLVVLPFFFFLKFRVSEVSIHCCSLATGPHLKSSPFFSHVNGYQLTPTIQTNFACLAAADLGQEVLLGFCFFRLSEKDSHKQMLGIRFRIATHFFLLFRVFDNFSFNVSDIQKDVIFLSS